MSADSDVDKHLKRIVTLLAILVTKDLDHQSDKITVLHSAGFQPKEIAELLVTTPNTVNVTLSSMRKTRKRASKSRNK